jgi:hypothetical protein
VAEGVCGLPSGQQRQPRAAGFGDGAAEVRSGLVCVVEQEPVKYRASDHTTQNTFNPPATGQIALVSPALVLQSSLLGAVPTSQMVQSMPSFIPQHHWVEKKPTPSTRCTIQL